MKRIWSLLILSALFLRADAEIVADGKLDEKEWKHAEVYSGFSGLKSRPEKVVPANDTSFRIVCDGKSVCVGIVCREPDMKLVNASIPAGPAANPWDADVVEIFFSPENNPDCYYQFVVGAGGATWQTYCEEQGNVTPDPFMPVWQAAAGRTQDAWVIEVKIPLLAFYMTPSRLWKTDWRVNVARNEKRKHRRVTSYAKLAQGLNEVKSFPVIGGFPVKTDDAKIVQAVASPRSEHAADVTVCVENAPEGALVNGFPVRNGKAVLTGEKFASSGRVRRRFSLVSGGKTLAERDYPVLFDYVPLRVKITYPQYADCYFPGEEPTHLAGEVSAPATVRIGKKEQSVSGKFSIRLDGVETKDFTAVFTTPSGYRATRRFRTIGGPADKLVFIRDGRLVIKGKPVFALGWYGSGGWNCSAWFKSKYPTPAAKHPFNFDRQINVEPERLIGRGRIAEMQRDAAPSERMMKALRETVEKYRDSGRMFYYLSDEPECRELSPVYLEHLYRELKRLDPTRPVLIVSRDPVRFLDACDIVAPHPYIQPWRDAGGRKLRLSVRKALQMCLDVAAANRRNKILMLTPQAFSYGFMNLMADYPTFDETMATVWGMVACGGQGLYPYIWYDHASTHELSLGMDFIYTSLDRLSPYLSGTGKTVNSGDILGRETEKLLILVNPMPEKRSAKIPDRGKKYPFRRGEKPVAPGKYEFAPYEVLILTTEPMDGGLPSLAEVRRRIREAEKARHSRGNLLFGRSREVEVATSDFSGPGSMEQQNKLFDGILDGLAWRGKPDRAHWMELLFPGFVPRFGKVRLFGSDLKGCRIKIFKRGAWKTPRAEVTESPWQTEFSFKEPLSTVKLRLEIPENRNSEIYEVELLP
ncbi:MAG: hypothetical protein IJS01_01230 [Lentisphaeria bacterium]|nr:hypothetical protein [Lentisphaeria bacterium]